MSSAPLVEQQVHAMLHRRSSEEQRQAAIDAISDEGMALAQYCGNQRVLQLLAKPLKTISLNGHPAESLSELALQVREAIAIRNGELLDDYHALAELLTGEGIEVRPLKGVAALLDGCYPDHGERLINDIDVLLAPDMLSKAMVSLAAAGYQQAVNRFEHQVSDTDMFGTLDVHDFRNQPAHVDAHVPRVLAPGASFNAEVHIHVTTQRSPLCGDLDQLAFEKRDTLFHLLHNFEHSHLKDGYGAQGLIDWRHLVDADRRLGMSDAPELAGELMQIASSAGVEADMAVHLWQLEHYIGSPNVDDAARNKRFARAIRRFSRIQRSETRRWLARQGSLIRRVGRGFVSRRVREERFGPVSTRQQLSRTWQFYRREFKVKP